MIDVSTLRFRVRLARSDRDIQNVLSLRQCCFRGKGSSGDALDSLCSHVMVEEAATERLVACFRLLALGSGASVGQSYSAQFYDLATLCGYPRPLVEVGRFCIAPPARDPDVLRLAWAAITRFVGETGAAMLFGCTSFPGVDPAPCLAAFALLADRHLAPPGWRPGAKAAEIVRFSGAPPGSNPDHRAALKSMPPLLRSYLAMGAWVSDHAVIDRDLGTLHVFTGLEIATIPPVRRATLRALADIDGGRSQR